MSELLLSNVESGTSDDDIKDFLVKYGFPEFDEIEHMPGEERPSVRLTFNEADAETLRSLQPRIQDMFWKNRKIHVEVMTQRYL